MGRARQLWRGAGLAAVLALSMVGAAWGQVTPPMNWTVSVSGPASITEGNRANYTISLSEAQPYDGNSLLVDVYWGRAASGSGGLESSADYEQARVGTIEVANDGGEVLSFDHNAVSHTFSLLITDDMVAELDGDETLRVSIGNIRWAFRIAGAPGPAPTIATGMDLVTTTIQDPRTEGLVSIVGPLTAADNGSDAVFTVRVDGTSTAVVTVNYSLGATGDTATRAAAATEDGADYVSAASGSVQVPMGTDETATITIATVDALATEASEFFTVTLTTVSGGGTLTPTLGASGAASRSARASIFGQPVTISARVTSRGAYVNGVIYAEGETVTVTLTLSGPQPISDIVMPYQIDHIGNEPIQPEDFGLQSLQQERLITLAEMAAARRMDNPEPITISLPVARDGFFDTDTKNPVFAFSASRPARGGGLGAITLSAPLNMNTVTLADDASRLLVEIRAMDVDEDGGAQDGFEITLTRDDPDGGGTIVQNYLDNSRRRDANGIVAQWTWSGATLGTDYTLSAGDGMHGFFIDADTPRNQFFEVTSANRVRGQPIRGIVRITPTDDSAYGGDKTVTMTLSAPSGGFLVCVGAAYCPPVVFRTRSTFNPAETDTRLFNPATLTIIDDEPQLSIAAPDPSTLAEGGAAVFTVTLRNPPDTGSVTVDWALGTDSDSNTDDAAAADFSGNTSGTLTFAMGGAASQQITLQTVVDGATENAEVFTVTLSNAMGGAVGIQSSAATATATIAANTAVSRTLALTAGANSVAEGAMLSYTVTMTGSPPAMGDDLTVNWSVGADSDTATSDAAAGDFDDDGDGTVNTNLPSGSVTFTSSDASGAQKTFSIRAAQNTQSQVNRTFVTTITASGGGGSNTVTPIPTPPP